jgi:DNA-binding NtrC family response regulator
VRGKILVVDDDLQLRRVIRGFFEKNSFEVLDVGTCQEALDATRVFKPDAILLDYSLPDGETLPLLQKIKAAKPDAPIIMLTGHGSIDLAVQAMKEGAENFFAKPAKLEAVKEALERALDRIRSKPIVEERWPFLGESPAIRRLEDLAKRSAGSDRPVLIQGETGSGKGVLANWLHRNGPRAKEPFVDLNCAGLSRELLESELFGFEKGAFTGAITSKPGLMEAANRGSIFLDEIGDSDLQVQAKLLKALEEKRLRRLGDLKDRTVDVRLIAATHHDLRKAVSEQRFRSDLFFRISVIELVVPSLRERASDIPLIAERLLTTLASEIGRGDVRLTPGALQMLQNYSWPGNVRELRNVLDRALLISDGDTIEAQDLLIQEDRQQAADDTVAEVERQHILRILSEEGGNIPRAAKRLGIPRSSLYKIAKKLGVDSLADDKSSGV